MSDFMAPFVNHKAEGVIEAQCGVCKKNVQHVQMMQNHTETSEEVANSRRNIYCRYSSGCFCYKCGRGGFNELVLSKFQPRIISGLHLVEYYRDFR